MPPRAHAGRHPDATHGCANAHTGDIRGWWIWAYWINPVTYSMRALTLNEFTAPRWAIPDPQNPAQTLGVAVLQTYGYDHAHWWRFAPIGILCGYIILMNVIIALALRFLSGALLRIPYPPRIPRHTPLCPLLCVCHAESDTAEPLHLANAEPNQKTAVIPAEKDREAMPDDSSHGRSRAERPSFHDDRPAAQSNGKLPTTHPSNGHLANGLAVHAANGHSDSWEEVRAGKGGKPVANRHANGVAADVEKGADGDGKPTDRGMVLPFSPVTVTFYDLHYFVPLPEARIQWIW